MRSAMPAASTALPFSPSDSFSLGVEEELLTVAPAALRRARARRHAGRRDRGARLQRDAEVDSAAAGARSELAVLLRKGFRARERPLGDLQLVPARRHPAGVRRLRGLRVNGRGPAW